MSGKLSAGILLYRRRAGDLEVLLAHPGGPYYLNKDAGEWSIPKGEPAPGETDLEAVARREFAEETGAPAPAGALLDLGVITQKSGKVVHGWAASGDLDPATVHSNSFELEWPPRSRKIQSFPEVDRVAWFTVAGARQAIKAAQIPLLERLEEVLAVRSTRRPR
jgi:predicted NUDIX family NTP pyrophosphohydrolase